MTRVLSELLGAQEPLFHQGLSRLEAASGHANTDIRLSTEIERGTKQKLRELGLDPSDTTGPELYAALQQRVKADDERLQRVLEKKYGRDAAAHEHVAQLLSDLPLPKSCFALKQTVGRRLLQKFQPKQTMKILGYRSFDSMMRREQLITIFAGAWIIESASWRKTMLDAYKKLMAGDFELRRIAVLAPSSKRWENLAETIVTRKKHTVVGLREFGAIVLLPLPASQPPAATLTTLLLALHEMNEVRAGSTFLKLCQVRPRFGSCVQTVVADEPVLQANLLDGPVPWQIIQRYYGRFADRFRAEIFEPHVQQEDLSWHSIEKVLSHIEPAFSFWHHTANLGITDHRHQPVSLNVIDAALSFCNQLPYEHRVVQYLRHSLWHELLIRYLKHENVEQMVLGSLESQLVAKPELLYSEA